MLVFRDGREQVAAPPLIQDFLSRLNNLPRGVSPKAALDLLLRAGEAECALADADCPAAAALADITDALADAVVCGASPIDLPAGVSRDFDVPSTLTLCRPEGFAYYALHPLNYADLAASIPAAARVAVIGIRSIGTTLSAVVAAAVRRRGVAAGRITVRPGGHPFDRRLQLEKAQAHWITANASRGAEFWVVDEGPGLSGSSFLSLGDALLEAGVPRERITFCCSVEPDVNRLLAPQAATRWPRFRTAVVRPPWRAPEEAGTDLSAGRWRDQQPGNGARVAVWPQFDRVKYRARDGSRLFKFAGLGPYGTYVLERATALARAGFGPEAQRASHGFIAYEWIDGRPLRAEDVSVAVLEQLADYCVMRAAEFPIARPGDLAPMMRTNFREEFGEEPELPPLTYPRPVIADAHMQPHEWLLAGDRLLKLDGDVHGDDHFFPGPTDIAWDLAGAIVKWGLEGDAAAAFLERYRRRSGDDPRFRLPGFLAAYSAFRLGYARMAVESLCGEDEKLFLCDAERYRSFAARMLAQPAAA